MFGRLPAAIANVLLAIASTLLCYVALEYALFRVALPYLPVDVRPHLPDMVDVLAQSSKAGYLPHDYVVLLGDSNAEGIGDWLLQVGGDRTKPFHSAHVIRQATGRDVVSFGKASSGSAEAIVLRPAHAFPASRCSVIPAIEPPRQIFVYFYEGNDVEDNIHFRDMVQSRYHRSDAEAIDRYLAEEYGVTSPWQCHWQLADLMIGMASFGLRYRLFGLPADNCGREAPRSNRLVVGDRIVEAPPLLGPSLTPMGDGWTWVGMEVLPHALSWLRQRFPGVPVVLTYVPSPLAVYRVAGDSVTYCIGNNIVLTASTAELGRKHELIRDIARNIARDQDIAFVDATPTLRAAAAAQVIHGPRDWDHLNEIGYRALGMLVAAHVQ